MRPRPAYIGPGRGTKKVPPVEAASKFLLVPAPMIVAVMVMITRIVGEVTMMITRIVGEVTMMVTAVIAMMVAVPSCGWDRAAGRDCADNAQCRSNFRYGSHDAFLLLVLSSFDDTLVALNAA